MNTNNPEAMEQNQGESGPKTISRRAFFRGGLKAGAALVAAVSLSPVAGAVIEPIVEGFANAASKIGEEKAAKSPVEPQTAEAAVEFKETTEYSVIDLRSAGEHAVILGKSADGKRIYTEEWNNGTLYFKDRSGVLNFFPIGAIQSESNPNLRAAFGKRAQFEDIGVLWVEGKAYGHNGGTVIDAQFDPENKFIITTEADLSQENQEVHFKFDLTTKLFTELKGATVPEVVIETALRPTEEPGVCKALGKSQVRRGAVETKIDTGNNTISTKSLYEDEGFAIGRLVRFIDAQGRQRDWLLNNDTTSENWENGSYTTLYDNINGVPTFMQPKIAEGFTSGSVNSLSAAYDLIGGFGFMTLDNNDKRFLLRFSLNDPTDLAEHKLTFLPGTRKLSGAAEVQVLTRGQNPYALVAQSNSNLAENDGLWIRATAGTDDFKKIAVLQQMQPSLTPRQYTPVIQKKDQGS